MGAIAPVDEVGMTVDEGGRDPAAFAIDEPAGGARGGWKLIFRPREDDSSLARGDRAGLDDPESRAPLDEGREAGVAPDRVGTVVVVCLNHCA